MTENLRLSSVIINSTLYKDRLVHLVYICWIMLFIFWAMLNFIIVAHSVSCHTLSNVFSLWRNGRSLTWKMCYRLVNTAFLDETSHDRHMECKNAQTSWEQNELTHEMRYILPLQSQMEEQWRSTDKRRAHNVLQWRTSITNGVAILVDKNIKITVLAIHFPIESWPSACKRNLLTSRWCNSSPPPQTYDNDNSTLSCTKCHQ